MPLQNESFECFIVDTRAKERFRARCEVVKKQPIAASRHERRIELAHIYIYALADTWKGAGVSFEKTKGGGVSSLPSDENYARKNDRPKDHSHFIVFDLHGNGKYVRRNRFGTDLEVRICST